MRILVLKISTLMMIAAMSFVAASSVRNLRAANLDSTSKQAALPDESNLADHAFGQSTVLLPTGEWLVTGGERNGEVLDEVWAGPVAASVVQTEIHLLHARTNHTTTVLPNGKILVVGGEGPDGAPIADPEIIDVGTGTIEP